MNRILKYFLLLTFFHIGFLPAALSQSKYDTHLAVARAHGIPPIKNQAQLNQLVKKKKLVAIFGGRGYTIGKLTHSRPYLDAKSNRKLKQIGAAFYKNSKRKTFTVTSVTRTIADQKRLARVNNNAVTTKLSSHNYGCAIDISYIRFNRKKAPNALLEKTLEKILIQMQKQKKLYYIKEYREKCFHITFR